MKERYNKYKSGQDTLLGVAKGVGRLAILPDFAKQQPSEKGYIYFQGFIPNDGFDIRVVVIGGEKAVAEKRFVRENDFRASGSGSIVYEKSKIDLRCIKISFDISDKLDSQCLAYDFIFSTENEPLIVEISYGFSIGAYDSCPGYWDNNLNWHDGYFNPQEWMIEDLIQHIEEI